MHIICILIFYVSMCVCTHTCSNFSLILIDDESTEGMDL